MVMIFASCKKPETIRIGLLMELSGRSSSLGIVGRNAVKIAIDDYNDSHKDKKLELIVKDNKGDSTLVEGLLNEFDQENVKIIIGPLTSNLASAIFESNYYKNNEMLFISPTVSGSDFSGIDDSFLTLINVNEKQGQILAEKALKDDINKMAIVYEESNEIYTMPMTASFMTCFQSGGGTITCANHFVSSENAPFSQLAQEIVESNPEGVLISAGGVDAAQLSQFIHKLNPKLKIYSGLWAKTEEFIQNGSKTVEGALLVATYDESNVYVKEFMEHYKEQFGSYPNFAGIHSYDAVQLLLGAIDDGIPFDQEKIKAYLLEKHTFNSLSATMQINEFGDCDRPYLIVEVKEGNYLKVDR